MNQTVKIENYHGFDVEWIPVFSGQSIKTIKAEHGIIGYPSNVSTMSIDGDDYEDWEDLAYAQPELTEAFERICDTSTIRHIIEVRR